MKNKLKKIGDAVSKVICVLSALGIVWIAVSVLCVKSARSRDNSLDEWNFFSVIQMV